MAAEEQQQIDVHFVVDGGCEVADGGEARRAAWSATDRKEAARIVAVVGGAAAADAVIMGEICGMA